MAEKIKIGNSFNKEVLVTTADEYGDIIPVDLSIYDDNYFAIKFSRLDSDEDAIIFKPVLVKGDASDGILVINLLPEETAIIPLPTDDKPYLEAYVQIGSTINGEVHEVSDFKVKTVMGGIRYMTPVNTDYVMGCIKEVVGYSFNAGNICEPVNFVVELGGTTYGRIVYDGGSLDDSIITIYDTGYIISFDTSILDLGLLRECTSAFKAAC